ncbi:hypothetical protein BDZ45DRAFT_782932 [Acephala macrosclerotiorum]|nr:hypothetical protein BDZ45DRAFT_782932 [Acephala macrosclerotiorum]
MTGAQEAACEGPSTSSLISDPESHAVAMRRQRAPTITVDSSVDFRSQPQRYSTPSSPLLSISKDVVPTPPPPHDLPALRRSSQDPQAPRYSRPIFEARFDRPFCSHGGDTLGPSSATSDCGEPERFSTDIISLSMLEHNADTLSEHFREESELHFNGSPFAFSAEELSEVFISKSIAAFRTVGGLQGLVHGLRIDSSSGLSLDEVSLDGLGHLMKSLRQRTQVSIAKELYPSAVLDVLFHLQQQSIRALKDMSIEKEFLRITVF